MLVFGIDTKILENQQENEDVVHAERFLNEVAGEKFEARPAPVREENPQSERYGNRDPGAAFNCRFANRNRVRTTVKQAQVEQEQ